MKQGTTHLEHFKTNYAAKAIKRSTDTTRKWRERKIQLKPILHRVYIPPGKKMSDQDKNNKKTNRRKNVEENKQKFLSPSFHFGRPQLGIAAHFFFSRLRSRPEGWGKNLKSVRNRE